MAMGTRPWRKFFPDRSRVLRKLTPNQQLVFFHLSCGRQSTPTGLFAVEIDLLARDASMSDTDVTQALDDLGQSGFIIWCPADDASLHADGVVFVVGCVQDSPPGSIWNFKGYLSDIQSVHQCAAVDAAMQELTACSRPDWLSSAHPVETPSTDSRSQKKKKEQKQEQKQEQEEGEGEKKAQGVPSPSVSKSKSVEDLLSAYRTECPKLPQPRDPPGKTLQGALASAWTREPNMEVWVERFRRAAKSPFLSGANDRRWTADILWLLKPENATKIDLGRYDESEARGPVGHHRQLPTVPVSSAEAALRRLTP